MPLFSLFPSFCFAFLCFFALNELLDKLLVEFIEFGPNYDDHPCSFGKITWREKLVLPLLI